MGRYKTKDLHLSDLRYRRQAPAETASCTPADVFLVGTVSDTDEPLVHLLDPRRLSEDRLTVLCGVRRRWVHHRTEATEWDLDDEVTCRRCRRMIRDIRPC